MCAGVCNGLGWYAFEACFGDERGGMLAQQDEGFDYEDFYPVVEMQRWRDFAMTFIEPMNIF